MAIFCLLCGGDSLESDISYVSYKKIKQELKYSNIATIDVYLNRFGEFYLIENNKLKKGQFVKHNEECFFKTKFKKYYFDAVLPIVHGKGVEDGSLGAYFDILKIPCMYSGITNASLLQNKSYFKKIIDFYDIPNVPYVDLSYYQYIDVNFDLEKHVSKLQFPLIVKPVNLGSSIGVKKVYDMESLLEALDKSFSYDSDVLIEKCVESLKEVNIALLGYKDNIIVSELETVSNKDDVLSFFDKYLLSKEKTTRIIPSDISKDKKETIIFLSKKVFRLLDCFGVVRLDFLLDEENSKVYLNEINTIPGSLAYYLFEPININVAKMIDILYEFYLKKVKDDLKRLTSYEESNKKDLLSKE